MGSRNHLKIVGETGGVKEKVDKLADLLRQQAPDRVDALFDEVLMPPKKRDPWSTTPITDVVFRVIKERDISAYALAKKTGVSQSIISRWLKGERKPGLHNVELIMFALDLIVVERSEVEGE
jgi:hypothetical protein